MKEKLRIKILIVLLVIIITMLPYFVEPVDSSIHSFYKALYVLPIALSAINFGFKGGILLPILISLLYSPNILLSLDFSNQTLKELLDIILFFVVGIVIGTIIEKKNLSMVELENQLKKYMLLERYTNGIIESIKSGVITINNDMLITIMNEGAKNLLNINESHIGDNFIEVFSCCEDIEHKIKESIEKNIIIENIEISLLKDRKELIVRISLFPLTFENMNKGIVITIEDITQIKKFQQQLQRNDKLAALGQLSAGVAHEIRNPLAIIKMIAQTMKNRFRNYPEIHGDFDIIDEEVERANKVIKSLMEYSKPPRDKKEYDSLNSIVDDVLIIVNKYVDQHRVNVEINKSEIPLIKVDKDQLKQAFVNLIFNAVEAMPNGGKLAISSNSFEGKWVKVVFEDTGIGISKEDIEKIFNPFFTTKDLGTGLGLSIVHRIVEDHYGIINVSSEQGIGTKFELLFPVEEDE